MRSALRDPRLYAVLDDAGDVTAVATQTPPFGLVLSEVDDPAIVAALADRLAADGAELPTANGPVAVARAFAERWASLTGAVPSVQTEERIYEAEAVIHPDGVGGAMRAYAAPDRPIVIDWMTAFFDEAMPGSPEAQVERFVDGRAAGAGSIVLWEDDGRLVSLAGHAGETPNGSRVGPVYTPPELRGRGYASALTAALTEQLLRAAPVLLPLHRPREPDLELDLPAHRVPPGHGRHGLAVRRSRRQLNATPPIAAIAAAAAARPDTCAAGSADTARAHVSM